MGADADQTSIAVADAARKGGDIMADYSANALQTLQPGEDLSFVTVEPCRRGLVRHREETGSFLLSGWSPRLCCCCRRDASYTVDFGANIAVPEGETVGEISMAYVIDGSIVPATEMIVTPAAVGEFFNISRAIDVDIWNGCCETLSIRNTSDIPIEVQNGSLKIDRADLYVTR